MSLRPIWHGAFLAGLLAVCSSCREKQSVPAMTPPAPQVAVPEKTPQPPPPPDIPPSQSGAAVKPPPNVAQTAAPPPPPKKKKKNARKHRKEAEEQTAQTGSAPAETQGAAVATGQPPETAQPKQQPAPAPLGQLLSDDTRRQYEQRIHEALENARATLRNARARSNLTNAQQNMAAQVETFIGQAEDARKTDIAAARSLAERAELLAHDLADSLR